MRRCRSVPVGHTAVQSCLFARALVAAPYSRHYMETNGREKSRTQPNADHNTGKQMAMMEPPDLTQHLQFGSNTLAHVSVKELEPDARNNSDFEKTRAMREKYGELGPGDIPTKNSSQVRRDMLEAQQDVDGLPWEVRWRKSLIPTPEEVIQDIRDRFDLYVQDPIDREVEWYLHWKDRGFKAQKDRLIWPQGFTDYLDQYDEHGRRRTLPSDQRWTDTSWKHLADVNYRDRMWMIEGEERKAIHHTMTDEKLLIAEEESRMQRTGDSLFGMASGVINLDPDQALEAIAGTADPLEVAKTRTKIAAYGAKQTLDMGKETKPEDLDPISGLPKSDLKPLPSGLTVEQGAAILASTNTRQQMLEVAAITASAEGKDPMSTLLHANLHLAKEAGDQPGLTALAESKMLTFEQRRKAHENDAALAASQHQDRLEATTKLLDSVEASLGEATAPPIDHSCSSSTTTTSLYAEPAKGAGYIPIRPRPANQEPNVAVDLYNSPRSEELSRMPEWYRKQLVETEPMIQSYGMVNDPLETAPVNTSSTKPEAEVRRSYYQPPELRDVDLVTNDLAHQGESAFDEAKIFKLRVSPETVKGYKPLPMFREVASTQQSLLPEKGAAEETLSPSAAAGSSSLAPKAAVVRGPDGKPLKRSEILRQQRQDRQKKLSQQNDMDASMLLPSLPWESDSVSDPNRGVSETDLVPYHKESLEKTWRTYRGFFQQMLTEYANLTKTVTEDRCEQMLYDGLAKVRQGQVGEHPEIDPKQLEVIRMVFEGHVKQFMSDCYRLRGNRNTEYKTLKSESDDLLRKAAAKSKLLGRNFMNFIQEMSTLELETLRKNPVQRHCVSMKDKRFEPLLRPFSKWIEMELVEFINTEFGNVEQIETQRDFLQRHCTDARYKTPMRLEGIADSMRDAVVEGMYSWCRALLCYYSSKHFYRLFEEHAESRFRSRSEELAEEANEHFQNSAKIRQDTLTLPVPDVDPPYEYDEKEFLDGEHGMFAELSGKLDKAEGIWHSGTTKRWFPILDETEYMWYLERRGRYSTALDISDRCLENLNKKSHPTVHPFPERAHKYLEGAPLTQETAEHLWLRYMGNVYFEHAQFMQRMGRYETSRTHLDKCLNMYHIAIRTAREKLPLSWKAPLYTEALYLMRSYSPGEEKLDVFLKEIDQTIAKLFACNPSPAHWMDDATDLPIRVALVYHTIAAYGEMINRVASSKVAPPTPEEMIAMMEQRAKGGDYQRKDYLEATNSAAEDIFRKRILQWRAKELEGSDAYLFWTHLYFSFRIHVHSPERVQQLWDMYEPCYLHIYTQAALANRMRGTTLLNEAIRRLCQILIPGNSTHKVTLMKELRNVREKMAHLIDSRELDRCINTLEAHMKNPNIIPYVYLTSHIHREAVRNAKLQSNPSLRVNLAAEDYKAVKERLEKIRQNGGNAMSALQAQNLQQKGAEDASLDETPSLTARDVFNE